MIAFLFTAFTGLVLASEGQYIAITEEVQYGFVAGLFLLFTVLKTTQKLGGK